MNIILYISNILAFAMLLIYHMHMYQLNSYNKIEQFNWLKENKYPNFGRIFGLVISVVFLIIFSMHFKYVGIFIAILLNIWTAIGNKEKHSKIRLKYTPRVKRMLTTSAIIYMVFFLSSIYLSYTMNVAVAGMIFIQILAMFASYIIMLSNILNAPIEKSINDSFINDAKKRINSMSNLTVIGITGSYGKTSVKHILGKLLSKDYNVLVTPKNYNTTLGVTITIREYLSPIHEIFVCEMGAKSLGEIKEICDIVNPRHGIITSIGPQHLETFLSLDNIITTKFELCDAISNSGTIFLNYDNEYIKNHTVDKHMISYAINNQNADYVPYDINVSKDGSSFMLKLLDEDLPVQFSTKLIGTHNVLNIAGCIAIAHKLGVSTPTLVQRVKQLEQVEHRQQIIKKDFGIIIDDAYNSNPSGAKSALDTLSMFDMTKIVITPGMVELGQEQYTLNEIFGKQIAKTADYAILVGKNQTIPIQNGIKSSDFDEKNLFVVDTIQDALTIAYSLKSDKQKAILLENDLPDNY